MDGFVPNIMDVQSEDKFKRASFTLFDSQERQIGQLDLSLSLIRKPDGTKPKKNASKLDYSRLLVSTNGAGAPSKLLNSQKILDNDSIPMGVSLSNNLKFGGDSSVEWNSGNFNGGKSMTMQEISDHFSKKSSNRAPKLEHMGTSLLSNTNNRFPVNNKSILEQNPRINVIPAPEVKSLRPQTGDPHENSINMVKIRDHLNASTPKSKPDFEIEHSIIPKNNFIEEQQRMPKKKKKTLKQKLEEVTKPMSIHEMANANFCPPPIIYHKKKSNPARTRGLRTKPVNEFNQAYRAQYSEANGPQKKKSSNKGIGNVQVSSEQPNHMANFVVLNEKATKNLLQGEKIDLQMNGKTLLDVFLNELAQLKREDNMARTGGSFTSNNPQNNQEFKVIVEHRGMPNTAQSTSIFSGVEIPDHVIQEIQKKQLKDPEKKPSSTPNQMRISKFSAMKNNKSGINPKSSINFSIDGSYKDSWMVDSNTKYDTSMPEKNKHLESIKESVKESGGRSSSRRSFNIDSIKESNSYHEDFDDHMTYSVSQTKESMQRKFNNFNPNTAEKSTHKLSNIRIDGKNMM